MKNELKLNAIRLPFYSLNILNADLRAKDEDKAFSYLDWFMSKCKEYEIYCVLDLHGAPGSQNGYEHSGTLIKEANLWDNEENRQGFVRVWDLVSKHYTNTRPDLGKWIATYDILNEPAYPHGGVTNKKCWDLYDEAYKVIRANNDKHVVTMTGVWDFATLPNPNQYKWENVMYQYHWYNWWPEKLSQDLFNTYQDMTNIGRDFNVPVFIGEFTQFDYRENWDFQLDFFKSRNYHWTVWSYKVATTGWWNSSWGVFTLQMRLDENKNKTKTNVLTCTEKEFRATCEKTKTKNCKTSITNEVLKDYAAKYN